MADVGTEQKKLGSQKNLGDVYIEHQPPAAFNPYYNNIIEFGGVTDWIAFLEPRKFRAKTTLSRIKLLRQKSGSCTPVVELGFTVCLYVEGSHRNRV